METVVIVIIVILVVTGISVGLWLLLRHNKIDKKSDNPLSVTKQDVNDAIDQMFVGVPTTDVAEISPKQLDSINQFISDTSRAVALQKIQLNFRGIASGYYSERPNEAQCMYFITLGKALDNAGVAVPSAFDITTYLKNVNGYIGKKDVICANALPSHLNFTILANLLISCIGIMVTDYGLPGTPTEYQLLSLLATKCHNFKPLPPAKPIPLISDIVDVKVYYWPSCPFCRAFILGDLIDAVKDVGDIMNLSLIPTRRTVDSKCPDEASDGECEEDLWVECAISHYPKASDYVPFVACMEKAIINDTFTADDVDNTAKICTKNAKFDYDLLKKCTTGPEGMALCNKSTRKIFIDQYEHGPMGFPHIVINGVVFYDYLTRGAFTTAICAASSSPNKPKACVPSSVGSNATSRHWH